MLATKSNSYTFQKGGIWYFSSGVPTDLRRHYRTGRIAYSLRTKSIRDARVRAMSDAAKLDRHWHIMRVSSGDLPGKHLLAGAGQSVAVEPIAEDHSFKAAVTIYLRLKGIDRPLTFEASVRRSCCNLIDCCGMEGLTDYVHSDATKFRDYLFAEGAGLLRSDFTEQGSILCVNIRPHPWRSLKTASSARIIPLVGSAKWAAERILAQPASSQFAFPNYNDGRNQPSTCGR